MNVLIRFDTGARKRCSKGHSEPDLLQREKRGHVKEKDVQQPVELDSSMDMGCTERKLAAAETIDIECDGNASNNGLVKWFVS